MKTARIVVSAIALLSLQSTLFCSEQQISMTRKDSFDALRDGGPFNGWLSWNDDALGNYTVDNCGKDYKEKEVRIGSQNIATQAWNTYDKNITTVEKAQKFLTAIAKSGVTFSEDITANSRALIAADKETKKLKAKELNKAAIALLQGFYITRQAHETEDATLRAQHEARKEAAMKELDADFENQQKEINKSRKQNKTELVATLQAKYKEIIALDPKLSSIFVLSEKGIDERKICKLANKYEDGKEKNRTFADITKGDL